MIYSIISACASVCAIVVFIVNILKSKVNNTANHIQMAKDYEELKKSFNRLEATVASLPAGLRSEFKTAIIEMRTEFKETVSDMRVDIKTLSTEVKGVTSKLAFSEQSIADIKSSVNELKGLGERVVVIEQSTKAAHKRIDELTKKREAKNE